MSKKPWDWGTWECEICGEQFPGERAEPPLPHIDRCDGAIGSSLVFEADRDE